MPLVSIVIPVCNGAAWLRPCLDGVLAQTMGDFELIAVDDASTDETPRILADYAARDARVSVATRAENGHAGVARNDGMARARGDYLLFLDADDLFEPCLLERATCEARRCDADMVLLGADVFERDVAQAHPDPFLLDTALLPERRPFNRDDVPARLFQLCSPEPWSKLFKRSFVEATGLRFQSMQNANDLFFTMAALAKARRVSVVTDVLVHHRRGAVGGVQACKAQEPLAFLEALCALRRELEADGLLAELELSFVNLVVFHCLYNASAPADWPRVFAELGVAGHKRGDFYIPGDYDRYVGLVLDAWGEGVAADVAACYGPGFWQEAALGSNRRARKAEEELERVLRSKPLRLGLALTAPLRKAKGLLRRAG